ncbi:MAG: energy transducer TonB [Proteobacteria bacterium]|nr:energy transducer TonB [Pseudomonadota bacterium]
MVEQTIQQQPRVSASDRLGFTLFLALTIHTIVVLGVGFTQSTNPRSNALPSLEIIFANSHSPEEVKNPDFIAQANQAGGGKADEKARPSAPVSSNTPINQRGLSDQAREELRRNQLAINHLYFISQLESPMKFDQQVQNRKQGAGTRKTSAVEQRQSKIARLQAEIRQMSIDYAKRPKSITLTASTKKAVEASYLASWVQKIEQTGNLNYPQEARIKKLDGQLRMNVRLNAAGEILSAKVTRSSGNNVLDQAAKRILRLAEPFAPFPEELKQSTDQIVIIRTWEFKSNRLITNGEVS